MKRMDQKLSLPLQQALAFGANHGQTYFEKLKGGTASLVILTCSCSRASYWLADENVWPLAVYGGAVATVTPSLDVALRQREIATLLIVGHGGCQAVRAALGDLDRAEAGERLILEAIAPAFAEGRGRALRNNVLRHIDYQVTVALERYGDLVKADKLTVVGAFLDEETDGRLYFVNYNGLKGKEKIAECLKGLAGDGVEMSDYCL